MTKLYRLAALSIALIPLVGLSAQTDAAGNWKAVFVGPIGDRPKMFDSVSFRIEAHRYQHIVNK